MKKYTAIIFDIMDSKKFKNRQIVQKLVKESVSYLNELYSNFIVKDVIFGAGDECQGLFKSIDAAFSYVRKLQLLIYPVKIRCGIGYGTLKYLDDDWNTTEIDGEAYYKAREGLDIATSKKLPLILFNISPCLNIYLNRLSLDNTIIKNKQSFNVKIIEMLADLINPVFYDEIYYKTELLDFYKMILPIKQEIYKENNGKETYFNVDLDVHFNYHSKLEYEIKRSTVNDELILDFPWERGSSYYFAEITSTSVQNINKHINLGMIKESRSIDYILLKYLGDNRCNY